MILGRSGSTTEASGSLDRGPQSPQFARRGRGKAASDWRRAVAVVSERRVAEGRALYTERSPAELYRGARSSERERYARQASRIGATRVLPAPMESKPGNAASRSPVNLPLTHTLSPRRDGGEGSEERARLPSRS